MGLNYIKTIKFSWLLAVCLLIATVQFARADVNSGIAWLRAQIKASGELTSEGTSVAYPMQVRSETAITLNATKSPPSTPLLTVIDGDWAFTVEDLARKALGRQISGLDDTALLDELVSMQNTDGGFGIASGFSSSPGDTSWALQALAKSRPSSTAATKALAWLIANQHSTGKWTDAWDAEEIIPTALSIQALHLYRGQATAVASLTKARAWLTGQKTAANNWGDDLRSAQSLLAILPGLSDATSMKAAVDALASKQRADGSWGGDPYITALAVRALYVASQPYTDPDLVSIRGKVVDDTTGNPIAGATIKLANAGKQATSDAQGNFSFSALTAGAETLSIEASGYRTLTSSLSLQKGQELDLGTIRMNLATAGATDVTLKGTVRYFNGTNYVVASNATIQVGALSAKSNSTGVYQLDGIPAGTFEVTVTYSGYPTVTATMTGQAGSVIDFNPIMEKPASTTATLRVVVTDSVSNALLSGVSVTLQPANTSRSTSATGIADFASGVVVGDNVVNVAKVGYQTAIITIKNTGNNAIEIPVALVPETSTQTVLKGTITDAVTKQPLAGATVEVQGTTFTTQTDTSGQYSFTGTGFTGSKTVKVSKPGYAPHAQTFTISGARTTVFDVPLQPLGQSTGPAELRVTVVDRSTTQPIANASVVLTGANSHTVTTDSSGVAVIAPLNPGATQILVKSTGYEAVTAQVDVQAGQKYVLPVDLAKDSSPAGSARLYGQVIDAATQAPISGAQVTVSGAWTGSVTSAANGSYEFPNIVSGAITITVKKAGYADFVRTATLSGTTEATIPMTPNWQIGNGSWSAYGTIIDADTLEPLVGASIDLEEVILGQTVTATQTANSGTGGAFQFDGLTQTNARVTIRMNGYNTMVVPFAQQVNNTRALGALRLKKSYNASLPDLQLRNGNRAGLVVDPNSFKASGVLEIQAVNNSNYTAGAFTAIVFQDNNGNQLWDAGIDKELARTRVNGLTDQQTQVLSFNIQNASLAFRDAPVFVMVDSGLEVIENIEGNNTLRVNVSCSGAGGGLQDVAVCVDASGSVSHLFNLEMEGVIKAVENPNIIPHDGSIRFSLETPGRYSTPPNPLHPAVVLTPATLPQLLQDLRNKRALGGDSSGSRCVNYMATYIGALPTKASKITAITVGDGYWEGTSATLNTYLPQAVAKGVGRVDVIGVGSVDLPQLQANAWPKPANSLGGGQVTIAYSSDEVAAAMAVALGNAAQTVDLTLGNFRMIDMGAGQVSLKARIGSAATASQPAKVRFYQGTVVLGEVAIPALGTGQWVDVSLDNVSLNGSDPLIAVVDEDRGNAECNVNNNRQQINLAPANALATIKVTTDKSVYSANAPAGLGAGVTNSGSFPADLSVVLSIEDSAGQEVVMFPAVKLGTLAPGATVPVSQPWNTASYMAGSYALLGRVFDSSGNVVAQDRTLFAITSGLGTSPIAALTVSTDKGTYTPNDLVQIGNVLSNLVSNTLIDDAKVNLTVTDPNGQTVFTFEHQVGQMPALATITRSTSQILKAVPLGTYKVEAVLWGAAKASATLASASTTYQVVAGSTTASVPGLDGTVGIDKTVIARSDALKRTDFVRNTGGVTLDPLQISRVVVRADTGAEVARVDQTIALIPGGQQSWPDVPVDTTALSDGDYVVLLIAQLGTQQTILDQKVFTVQVGGLNPPQPGGSTVKPVPADSPLALIALALAAACCGAARAKRRQTI